MKFFDIPIVISEQQPRDRISLVRDEGYELCIDGPSTTLMRQFREVGHIDLKAPSPASPREMSDH